MNDAISRAKVFKFLNRMEEAVAGDDLISETAMATIKCARRYVTAIPSVDTVPVVTCERCRYSEGKPIADGRLWCDYLKTFMRYCSEGDCREDGAT